MRRQRHLTPRHAPDNALEARRRVVQVGSFDQQVGLGQGQPAGNLFEIDRPRDLGLDTLVGLRKDGAVLDEVFFRQLHQFAVPDDIVVRPCRLQRDAFGRSQQLEDTHPRSMIEPAHVTQGREPVIEQLGERQRCRTARVLAVDRRP